MVLSVWDDEADEVLVCVMVCVIVLVDTGGVIEKSCIDVLYVFTMISFYERLCSRRVGFLKRLDGFV